MRQERRATLARLGLVVTLAALALPGLLVALGQPERRALPVGSVLLVLSVLLALMVIPDPKDR
ncbi:hypothetical protein [Methylobacterium sp. PvR107]|uniref:hypothetical protein n=1 Tax=Methylobacterium sp. PvR107 TaxID=2806597 RepID=UPI001B4AEB6B|nr:hypothetical protein [Methylobacterium sp. PvR107]MBP1179976.1 inner membrane protein involved in colicin E2 resistance [Methylobacterium sp. PvR107]